MSLPLLHLGSKWPQLPPSKWAIEKSIKPTGIWYSVGWEWPVSCLSFGEGDRWLDEDEFGEPQKLFLVRIPRELNICRIRSRQQAEEFHKKFSNEKGLVHWSAVADKYDGLEISPYNRGLSITPQPCWHWTWDCSSGVIWSGKPIVREIRPWSPHRFKEICSPFLQKLNRRPDTKVFPFLSKRLNKEFLREHAAHGR